MMCFLDSKACTCRDSSTGYLYYQAATVSSSISSMPYLFLDSTRSYRFREMCEEVPAVKALNFLQNDVFTTVDHNDPEETSIFRSLLSHLLIPSPSSIPSTLDQPSSRGTREADSESEENDAPPKKRSRHSTPEELWTSRLDEDELMAAASPSNCASQSGRAVLSMEEDPEERVVRSGGPPLSAARFQQRTEVFESLLEFIEDQAKQPSGNLLDMVDRVDEGL